MFAKWTIDGVQHQFNKNWLDRQNMGFLRNTGPFVLTKIQIYILTRTELLWYEIPCTSKRGVFSKHSGKHIIAQNF